MDFIKNTIKESIKVKQDILSDKDLLGLIYSAAEYCIECFTQGNKILLCGNGGSAADAQHIAAELTGRFQFDRKPLYAEALHVNTSYLTAVANDYHYDKVFSRMVEAVGKSGDVLIALSTSGNSKNVVEAAKQARNQDMIVIGLTGRDGGELLQNSEICLKVPSNNTARIQESHIMIGHILCEKIENTLFHR